ncbi:MAG: hypothetical protein COA78_09265 [Blastopirellula sp.]|nr:MAG: hypothetical protein COA78_09265 [Blastopirellula sp.]
MNRRLDIAKNSNEGRYQLHFSLLAKEGKMYIKAKCPLWTQEKIIFRKDFTTIPVLIKGTFYLAPIFSLDTLHFQAVFRFFKNTEKMPA